MRYYEEIGLLPAPRREQNQYRHYSTTDLHQIRLVRRLRLLGVPLEALRPLLKELPSARCVDVQEKALQLIDHRLEQIQQEIAELQTLQQQMTSYRNQLQACATDISRVLR